MRHPRSRPSNFRLTATQRSVHSWTRWRLSRTRRRQARTAKRLLLLRLETDRLLLQEKELEQLAQQLVHRQSELTASRSYRLQETQQPEALPEVNPRAAELLAEISRLNGPPQPLTYPPDSVD